MWRKGLVMPFGVDVEIRGLRKALRKFDRIQNKSPVAIRRVMSAGAGIFKKGAGPAAPKETGLLRRSFRVKVVHHRTGAISARAQVRENKRAVRKTKKGRLIAATEKTRQKMLQAGEKVKYRNPLRYAHLVELGTKYAEATHFLKQMFLRKENEARRAMIARIKKEIALLAKK
jgi:HK97 gp10 family phage protein